MAWKLRVSPKSLSSTLKSLNTVKNVMLDTGVLAAMTQWAKLVASAAKRFVPVKTGALREDISYYLLKRTTRTIVMKISTKPKEATKSRAYAFFLEFGTQPHWVEPSTKKALHWVDPSGEHRFSKGHMVSGIKATRFMMRAYLSTKAEGGLLLGRAINNAIKSQRSR